MRIYLDNCCLNRPFDAQDSLTVRMETEAKLQVQSMVKSGVLTLGWSYVLDFENAANPYEERRTEIQRWGEIADQCVEETPEIINAMRDAVVKGLKPLDALHLACAMAMPCEVFLTVDKGLLRKGSLFEGIRVLNPINFVMEKEGGL